MSRMDVYDASGGAPDIGDAGVSSLDGETSTAALVRNLVRCTLASHGASDAPDASVERMFRYAVRLVGSSLSADVEPDEDAAADAIARRLRRREGGSPNDVAVFADLHRRMKQVPGLQKRWAVLHALLRASEEADKEKDRREGGAWDGDDGGGGARTNALSFAASAGGLPALRPDGSNRARERQTTTTTTTTTRDPGDARALANGDGSTLGVDHPSSRAAAMKLLAREATLSAEVGEPELVRDVLFACQGIDGKFLKFDPAEGAYVVRADAPVSPGAAVLARKLTELGWLFRKIRACLGGDDADVVATTTPASADSDVAPPATPSLGTLGALGGDRGELDGGSVRRAFKARVQGELSDYYRLIAVLEAQAQVPMAAALESARDDSSGETYLTLRRLSVWLAEPTRRLRLLAVLVDASRFNKGGALLGVLHAHAKHGDPALCATVARLLSAAAAPMYAAIQNWVVLGELDDPRSEFFVTSDPAVAEEDLWRHRYGVDDAMLPPFITREQAADVLRVGKSINFLRRCCDDDGWTAERAPVAAAAANAGGLGYGNPKALDALIAEAKRRIDRCLRRVLFERYKLFEHCFAVKRYLLLGQGDFHACLMDLAGEDLAEPASNVSAYKLSGTLESAIRASNAQYDESDVLDRLRVKMMPAAGADEVGWDVFSLEYQTSAPLTTVFTPDAMGKYLRVFTFLWRLKRVEHALCATWQTMKPNVTAALARDGVAGAAGVALAEELRRCHTLRGEMHHFIANLQYYVMFEVLEGSWEVFTREMRDARDLDSLIAAHERYLDAVLQKALLGPKSQLLAHALSTLFEVVLRFRGFADRLYDVARDAAMRRQLARLRVEQRAEQATWGSLPGEDAAGGDGLLSEAFVSEMREQLDAVGADYAKMLDGFLNLLPLQTHVDLKFLLFRLDFSEYYCKQKIGPSPGSLPF